MKEEGCNRSGGMAPSNVSMRLAMPLRSDVKIG